VPSEELLTTSQLARALGLSVSSIKRYIAAGQIEPELTTPGGHYRWSVESVRRQLRELRARDEH
jgi:DNA-binding transcriptional MerR regulator